MSGGLVKAQLCEVSGDDRGREIGTPIDVQFNPTTLRVAISNKSAGGQQGGSQARQSPGTGEISVSFDLVFDSADEGETDTPVPVTRKTQIVEKFVRPPSGGSASAAPPRVQFKWGSFLVQGIMESANIDLDLFAQDGTPLRAKVAVSIKGQDPSYRYDPIVSGGGPSAQPPPGPRDTPPGAPGTRGGAPTPSQVVPALPGESLQQLAARKGLDPNAWRALADGIANPLSLADGVEVALPGALRGSSGVARTSSAPASPDPSAGLPLVQSAALPDAGNAPLSRKSSDALGSAQSLARQGGVNASIAQVRGAAQTRAVGASFQAFGIAQSAPASDPDAGANLRPYGSGVPLRATRGAAGSSAPSSSDPSVPSWQALPPRRSSPVRAPGSSKPRDNCRCRCSDKPKR